MGRPLDERLDPDPLPAPRRGPVGRCAIPPGAVGGVGIDDRRLDGGQAELLEPSGDPGRTPAHIDHEIGADLFGFAPGSRSDLDPREPEVGMPHAQETDHLGLLQEANPRRP
jgi:hypothetical protein